MTTTDFAVRRHGAVTTGAPRSRGPRNTKHMRITLPLIAYGIFTLIPFYWLFLYAFKEPKSTGWFPWPLTFENFVFAWNDIGFNFFFWNSMIVGVLTTVFTLLVAMPCGYALARLRFRGKQAFMLVLLCTQFVPGALMLIPLYQTFNVLGMINSLTSLVIADTVFHLPLVALFMTSFIGNVPYALEEAAQIDGCSRVQAFRRVVLPQLGPATVAVGAFAFLGSWNNFLFALMFIQQQNKFTIPVGLSFTIGEFGVDFGVLAAGGVIAAIPVIIIFAYMQKFLVGGLNSGAIKG